MSTESDTSMLMLAAVLADPVAAKERLDGLNKARQAADLARKELETRKEHYAKIEKDANENYKKASEERLQAERALKVAEDKRKETQQILDKIGLREAAADKRDEELAVKAAASDREDKRLSLEKRRLEELDESLSKKDAEVSALRTELQRKIKAIKDIAA